MNWMPGAEIRKFPSGGAFVPGAKKRGVLHSTEGSSVDGAMAAYQKKNSAPHFTVSGVRIVQHIPVSLAARALKNKPGGVETNRLGAIQIEVVGFAAKPDWDEATITNVRRVMRWVESVTGVVAKAPIPFPEYPRRRHAPNWRMTPAEWEECKYWVGHAHVPENDHGDPGAIVRSKLFYSPTNKESPMFSILDIVDTLPCSTGGAWILTQNGSVYAVGGAPYLGGANTRDYFKGRTAHLLHAFGTGYTIVATSGETYSYPGDGSER